MTSNFSCHDGHTFKHVLALAVKDTRSGLELLASEKVGNGQSLRVRGSRCDGLSSTLATLRRVWVWVVVVVALSLAGLLLRLRRAHSHLLSLSLLLDVLDKLGHGHAILLGIDG